MPIPAPALPPNPRRLLLHRLFTAAALDSLKCERRHANVKGVLGTRGARRCGLGSTAFFSWMDPTEKRKCPANRPRKHQVQDEDADAREERRASRRRHAGWAGAASQAQCPRPAHRQPTRHSRSHPSLRDALHGVTATLVMTRPPFPGGSVLSKPRKFTSAVSRRPRTPSQVEKIEQTSPKLEANSSSPQPRPDEPCNEQVYVDTSTGDKYYGKNLVVTPQGTIYKPAFQSKM